MRVTMVTVLPVLATLVAGSAVGAERFRLVPTERPTPRSCIEVELRGEAKVVAFYDEHGTIVKEITLELPCNYPVVSKNKQNVVIREPVGECDMMAHYRLHLYDAQGTLVATSEPMMLYDLSVEPMGNDSTVLVIYPAAEVPVFSIVFLQARRGDTLANVATFREERGNPWWDIGLDGQHCVIAMDASSREGKADVALLGSDGTVTWRVALDESRVRGGLTISPHSRFVIACSEHSEAQHSHAYLLSMEDGHCLGKINLPYVSSTPRVAFTRSEGEEFFALCANSEVHLVATETAQLHLSHADVEGSLVARACAMLEDRTILALMIADDAVVDRQAVTAYVSALDKNGDYHRVRTIDSPHGPMLHQHGERTYLEFAFPDGQRWYEIEDAGQ